MCVLVPRIFNLHSTIDLGLSEEARADFAIMKDVSAHTRVSPSTRHERMIKFMAEIRQKQV